MPRSKKSEIPEIVETDTSAVNLTEAPESDVLDIPQEIGAEETAGEDIRPLLLSDDDTNEKRPATRRKKTAQPKEPSEEPASETAGVEADLEPQLAVETLYRNRSSRPKKSRAPVRRASSQSPPETA